MSSVGGAIFFSAVLDVVFFSAVGGETWCVGEVM